MKVTYDPEVDVLRIVFREVTVASTPPSGSKTPARLNTPKKAEQKAPNSRIG